MSNKKQNQDTVDFSPRKEDMYRAIMADVDVAEAVLEITDNAIDNWERVSNKTDPLTIEVFTRTTDDGDTEFVIRDDSGGIQRDELQMLFGVGHSARDEIEGSVGAYGVGAKRAILRLADEATIATRYKGGTDAGYGFTVDKDWLEEDTWKRPVETFDIPEGQTEIRLRDLNFQPEKKLQDIRAELQQAYEIFLGGGPQHASRAGDQYDFVIRVDGDAIEQPDPVNWSFTPYDGLFPRQFRNIRLDSKETGDAVYLDVTVGLMQKASAADAGTDVYLQNRKVHDAATDEQGGFGDGYRLDSFGGQQKRLKIIVELHTNGDSRDLPWTSSKTGLDTDSEITEQAFDWVGRIADRYYDAVYGTVPQTFLRPYGRDAEYAVEGQIGENALDYESRKKVTDKPEEGYPTIQAVKQQAVEHARLGVKYADNLKPELVPGYVEHLENRLEEQFDNIFGSDYEPIELDRDLPITLNEIRDHTLQLDSQARSDAEKGQRFTGLDPWEEPRYEAVLRDTLPDETDIDDLEAIESREVVEESEQDPQPVESVTETSGREQTGLEDVVDDQASKKEDAATTEEPPSPDDDGSDVEGESDVSTEAGDLTDNEEFTIAGQGLEEDESEPTFDIALTPEQQEVFEEVLGIDDFAAASPEKRGEALADRMEQLQAVLQAATPQGD